MERSENFDVIIVGAGPAGSSLAIRLAMAGFRVAIAEQKKFPRHKLCGEFISPECLIHFSEIGVSEKIAAANGAKLRETVFYSLAGRSVSIRSDVFGSGAVAVGLSRSEMDEILLDRARSAGVVVFEETTATGLIYEDLRTVGIELRAQGMQKREVFSPILVDATGRSRMLVKRIHPPAHQKPTLTAFKTHLAAAKPQNGVCEIYSYPAGYGGLNSVGELSNICFIASADAVKQLGNNPAALMRQLVMRNPRASETLAEAEAVEPWLAVAIERFGTIEPSPLDGLIAIGDAASFIDPFTGSGMLMAMESARLAASVIQKWHDDPASLRRQYLRAYCEKFSTRLRYSNLLRYASRSTRIAEIAVATLNASSYLRTRVARATRS
jgi:flavin-dependent dehydrogenase